MQTRYWMAVALAFLGVAAVQGAPPAARAAPVPVPAPTPAPAVTGTGAQTSPAAVPDAFTQELLRGLNSVDAARHAAAEKQLAAIASYWQQPELLQRMLEVTSDDELKVLITQRLNEIKVRQAQQDVMNLPPISLSVNNASLTQLADALGTALNIPGRIVGAGSAGTFTLEAKNKPFWEVFAALAQDDPLTITGYQSGMRLQTAGGMPLRRFAISGPMIGILGNINFRRAANLQTPTGDASVQPPALTLSMVIGVDPRIRVTRLTGPNVLKATDDTGANLVRNGGTSTTTTATNVFNVSLALTGPENLGKSLSLTVEGRITAQATEVVGTLNDVQNNLNSPTPLGTRSFQVTRFTPNGNSVSFQVNLAAGVTQPGEPAPRALAVMLDSTGKQVWSAQMLGAMGSSFSTSNSTGPYKLEMHLPDKMVEIPFHFEFDNVTLP